MKLIYTYIAIIIGPSSNDTESTRSETNVVVVGIAATLLIVALLIVIVVISVLLLVARKRKLINGNKVCCRKRNRLLNFDKLELSSHGPDNLLDMWALAAVGRTFET